MKKERKTPIGIKRIPEQTTIDPNIWDTIVTVILLTSAVWHLQHFIGWFTGDVLMELYHIENALAKAIVDCPYILFYATYIAAGFSGVFLIGILYFLYAMLTGKMDADEALTPTMLFNLSTIWLFPIIHAVADLTATTLKVRDTSGFDVFQLGIDMIPMVIISAVCCLILWVGNKIRSINW